MKKNEIKQKYLEALCDQKEESVETLKQQYESFQARLNKNKGG